jgi:hypothetical protein
VVHSMSMSMNMSMSMSMSMTGVVSENTVLVATNLKIRSDHVLLVLMLLLVTSIQKAQLHNGTKTNHNLKLTC